MSEWSSRWTITALEYRDMANLNSGEGLSPGESVSVVPVEEAEQALADCRREVEELRAALSDIACVPDAAGKVSDFQFAGRPEDRERAMQARAREALDWTGAHRA